METCMADPENPVVIVTGGARGLGRAMTLALLRSGARVAVADLPVSAPEIRELKEIAAKEGAQDRLLSVECDVTRWQSCTDAVAKVSAHFGALHGLVNDAAIGMQGFGNVLNGKRKRFYEADSEAYRKSIDTNVTGPFMMAKAVAPHLVAQGFGRIVNITTSHFTMVMNGFSPYGPSKAAMEAATVVWSKDLAGTGVTVNALIPGGAANTRMIPQGEVADRSTLVQPEVMMAPIVWLMSPRSNGVTGRRIIAKEWDAARLASTPADKIGSPAGW
jgi:NAD(P)-dependent dehydrogenase (short-subunit alcohol dehydrogenase family)